MRAILQGWDPIDSIEDAGPSDEYDDLIGAVRDALTSGISADALATGILDR